ncbi:MAG: hypothetical protein Q9162_006018 [Coniocarpon cinnabarinum]
METGRIRYQIHFNRDIDFDWFRWIRVDAILMPGSTEPEAILEPPPNQIGQARSLLATLDDVQHDRSLIESVLRAAFGRFEHHENIINYKLQHRALTNLDPDEYDRIKQESRCGDYWVYDENESILREPDPEELELESTDEYGSSESSDVVMQQGIEKRDGNALPDQDKQLPRYRVVQVQKYIYDSQKVLNRSSERDTAGPNPRIGRLFARLIRRDEIREHFWEDMEEPAEETWELAYEVFNRYGFVRRCHVEGSASGSQVWGYELNDGDFLLIEGIHVNNPHQRQGIARKLIEIALAETSRKDVKLRFAIARADVPTSEIPYDMSEKEKDDLYASNYNRNIRLLRNAGFRMIGASGWLAWAVNKGHRSHQIPADHDYDAPKDTERSELEEFTRRLETSRTVKQINMFSKMISDHFIGYGIDDIQHLLRLRGENPDAVSPETIARTRFGCTCGLCYCGFISPRMRYSLKSSAFVKHDMLGEEIESVLFDHEFDHITKPDLRSRMNTNKSLREGYCDLFLTLANTLDKDTPLNSLNIGDGIAQNVMRDMHSQWPPHMRNFLEAGGSMRPVIRATVEDAANGDPFLGDNRVSSVDLEELASLPECRNDCEYSMVYRNLVINRLSDGSISEDETYTDLALFPSRYVSIRTGLRLPAE